MSANLVFSDWSMDQPNLWHVQQNSFTLVQGQNQYVLPYNILQFLDCYIEQQGQITTYMVDGYGNQVLDGYGNPTILTQTGTNTAATQDRILYGVSRSEFNSYPNKYYQAFPTVYWADRRVPINVYIYPAPDGNGPYQFFYWAVVQDQDASVHNASTLPIPYRMYAAFADGLAAKMALSYAPDRFTLLQTVAEKSYKNARDQESEDVQLVIAPGIESYYL